MKNKLNKIFIAFVLIDLIMFTIYNIIDTVWTINQQRIGSEYIQKSLDHYREYELGGKNSE